MDRAIIYPGAIPASADILFMQRSAMIADGYLAAATVGSGPVVDGLAATPAVGSLGVVISSGSIFQSTVVDQNSFSSLSADSDPVVKIGVNAKATTFPLTAPTTAGQSISYLIEAAFLESDGASSVIPYYNSANPAQPFSGPGGAGGAQLTRRLQSVQLQLRQGVAANAGTQATPAIDAGWVGLYIITVNYGESGVQPGDIAILPGAPFIGLKLPALNAAVAALEASFSALAAKEAAIRPGTSAFLVTDGSPGIKSFTAPWTGIYRITVTGAGGGGGGSTSSQAGGGGGAGGTAIAYVTLQAGQVVQYAVGAAGLMGSDAGANGGYGGSSSFGQFLAGSGGGPGQGGQNGTAGGQGGAGTCASTITALLLYGGCGSDGSPTADTYGGLGGASYWGGGARGGTADGVLENGPALGSGGGGAYYGAHGGGYGAPGIVVVEG